MDRECVSPHRVHECRGPDRPVRVEDQASQQRTLPAGPENDDVSVVIDDVNTSQDPKKHAES
jgi:hypothetical protein